MTKVAPDTRIIGGKRYYFMEGYPSKASANAAAKTRRRMGYAARVVTIGGIKGWFLYVRDKSSSRPPYPRMQR